MHGLLAALTLLSLGGTDAGAPTEPPSASAAPTCQLTCAATGDDPKTLNDRARLRLDDDPRGAACAAQRAAQLAHTRGDAELEGSAQFNLGWAFELLRCPSEAWRAYRASLCARPKVERVEKRCSDFGDCFSPCTPPPSDEPHVVLRVHEGNVIASADEATLCLGPCTLLDRKSMTVTGGEIDVRVFRLQGGAVAFAVLGREGKKRPKVLATSVLQSYSGGSLEDSLELGAPARDGAGMRLDGQLQSYCRGIVVDGERTSQAECGVRPVRVRATLGRATIEVREE